ncbi:unnamed protein product [Phytophthora fragariaefolia]|uniref:Unnamed protein product n=1 Tax=Phytophthora fragariaefolia TaxID=1490495 RepID=A0A9W6UFE4_9STRA|nr:unnamed protein product [Phytophthora fragariaefolia]
MLLGDDCGKKYDPFIVFKSAPAKTTAKQSENNARRHGFGEPTWREICRLQRQFRCQIYGYKTAWWNADLSMKFLEFHFANRENLGDKILLLWDDLSAHWTQEKTIRSGFARVGLLLDTREAAVDDNVEVNTENLIACLENYNLAEAEVNSDDDIEINSSGLRKYGNAMGLGDGGLYYPPRHLVEEMPLPGPRQSTAPTQSYEGAFDLSTTSSTLRLRYAVRNRLHGLKVVGDNNLILSQLEQRRPPLDTTSPRLLRAVSIASGSAHGDILDSPPPCIQQDDGSPCQPRHGHKEKCASGFNGSSISPTKLDSIIRIPPRRCQTLARQQLGYAGRLHPQA